MAKVYFIALFGIETYPVEVEISLPGGLPLFNIDFPDVAAKEARAGSRIILLRDSLENPKLLLRAYLK